MKEIVEFRSYKITCANPMPDLFIESLPEFKYVEIELIYVNALIEDPQLLNIPSLFNVYVYPNKKTHIKLNKNQIHSKTYNNIIFERDDNMIVLNMNFYK